MNAEWNIIHHEMPNNHFKLQICSLFTRKFLKEVFIPEINANLQIINILQQIMSEYIVFFGCISGMAYFEGVLDQKDW